MSIVVLLTVPVPPVAVVAVALVTEPLPRATEFATFAVELTPSASALVAVALDPCAIATDPLPDALELAPNAVAYEFEATLLEPSATDPAAPLAVEPLPSATASEPEARAGSASRP